MIPIFKTTGSRGIILQSRLKKLTCNKWSKLRQSFLKNLQLNHCTRYASESKSNYHCIPSHLDGMTGLHICVGEPALIPTAPAILNAICHALDIRVTELPANPENIKRLILKKRKEEEES